MTRSRLRLTSGRLLLSPLLLLGIVLLVVGGSAGRSAPASATPVDDQPCPVASHICAFAGSLYGWLATGDYGAVVAHAEPIEVICNEFNRSRNSGASDVCRRSMVDERRLGYPIVAEGLIGFLATEEGYRTSLREIVMQSRAGETDRHGAGAFRVAGVAVVNRTDEERARAEFDVDYIVGMTSIICGFRGITRQMLIMGVKQRLPDAPLLITVTGVSTATFRSEGEADLFQGLLPWSVPLAEHSRGDAPQPDLCFDPATLPNPDRALLTLDDLPQGWRGSAFVERDRAFPIYPEKLCGVDPLDLDLPTATLSRRSANVQFSGGRNGPFLWHHVRLFGPGEAARMMAETQNVFAPTLPCRWSETSEDGIPFSVTLVTLPAPSLGDEAIAIREVIQTPDKTRISETVMIRVQDAVISLDLQVIGTDEPTIDQQFLDALLRRALERLATISCP